MDLFMFLKMSTNYLGKITMEKEHLIESGFAKKRERQLRSYLIFKCKPQIKQRNSTL